LSEDIVYELTKILYENANKFNGWHAQGASVAKEFLPSYMKGPEWMHKGALKYYKEHNIMLKSLLDFLP
jgi:TRAP-type uncharacterized transport system substrate-binding protein